MSDNTSKNDANSVKESERPDNSTTSSKSEFRESLSTFIWALGLALIIRTFIFQPFHIPSGSMEPGLVKGDYIITTKYSLGYGKFAATPLPFPISKGRLFERKPLRGDVIVFRPKGQNKNFIKRLVGLPGDEIQIIDGRLYLNGVSVKTEVVGVETRLTSGQKRESATRLQEYFSDNNAGHFIYDIDPAGKSDNTSTYIVPAGHYFFMGDNRDRSADSRVPTRGGGAGYVPAENLMGKATIVLLSINDNFSIFKPWTWANLRKNRFFKAIE